MANMIRSTLDNTLDSTLTPQWQTWSGAPWTTPLHSTLDSPMANMIRCSTQHTLTPPDGKHDPEHPGQHPGQHPMANMIRIAAPPWHRPMANMIRSTLTAPWTAPDTAPSTLDSTLHAQRQTWSGAPWTAPCTAPWHPNGKIRSTLNSTPAHHPGQHPDTAQWQTWSGAPWTALWTAPCTAPWHRPMANMIRSTPGTPWNSTLTPPNRKHDPEHPGQQPCTAPRHRPIANMIRSTGQHPEHHPDTAVQGSVQAAVQGAPDHVCHWAVSGCCSGCSGSCLPFGVRVLSGCLPQRYMLWQLRNARMCSARKPRRHAFALCGRQSWSCKTEVFWPCCGKPWLPTL